MEKIRINNGNGFNLDNYDIVLSDIIIKLFFVNVRICKMQKENNNKYYSIDIIKK